ncbi:hypothetical protein [Phenylobacterium sp.]|uniref:hypothetical protein n=1 Tax=Phenylobacterium sp. TaxID=1871053 RepID=UPI00286E5B00|nr:hypothetical protein [Phenylobacterium sp.]
MTREQQIEQEARDLWKAMKEGCPPCGLHGSELIDALVRGSEAPPYERLHSPFLRDSQIRRPR